LPVPETAVWSLDTGEVIEAAMRRLRKPREVAADLDVARDGLQFTFSKLQSVGINLWTMRLDTHDLALDENEIVLPADVVDVLSMVWRDTAAASPFDMPMTRIDAETWLTTSQKDTGGPPGLFFVDRQRDNCILHISGKPDRTSYRLVYWVIRRFKDIGNMLEQLDVPVHWLGLITAGVAYYLGMCTPDLTEEHRAELKATWGDEFATVSTENRDRSVFRIEPDLTCYHRL
jgi:hypothetical protein